MTRPAAAGRLPSAGWLLGGLLLIGGALAQITLVGHYDALDRDRALLIVQTERFGPGTRGRIAAWAEATTPGEPLTWAADDPPLLGDRVPVDVRIGPSGPYRFEVDLGARAVYPLDGETRGLVDRIAQWAARPATPR